MRQAALSGVKLGIRIEVGVILTMHEIARSRIGPVIGTGSVIQYRVDGLPPGEDAFIANFGGCYEESWRVFRIKSGVAGRWDGYYQTADDALVALQKEY